MAVRVRVRISVGGRSLETIALVNTGYEAETPQILIPIPAAEALGVWPPEGAFESTYETAGGPLRTWIYPRRCSVKIVAEGAAAVEVEADLVVSPIADEVLVNDKLTGKLQIVLEDAGQGLWRLRQDPQTRLRPSEPPKYWK
jgi:hypothetical protein